MRLAAIRVRGYFRDRWRDQFVSEYYQIPMSLAWEHSFGISDFSGAVKAVEAAAS